MKTQFFQMEFKSVEVKLEENKLIIEGFASTPDIDSYDDIVKPEAFEKTMSEYMRKPLVLLQHNRDKIIGKVAEYRIEPNGLWVKIELFNDLDGCFRSIQEGLLGQFSIGFQSIKWNIYELGDRYIREITELRLVEISVVAFPANKNAKFTIAKSLKEFFDNLEKKDFGTYEIKGEEIEFTNFEKEQELELEVKEDELEENKPVDPEITPEIEKETEKLPEEEDPNKEIQPDVIETVGETPKDDNTDEKTEKLEALQEEIELLKKDKQELQVTLEAKDEEIENITKSKAEIEKKLEEKELEIKEYLGNGTIVETKSKLVTFSKTYSLFDNL